MNCICEENFEYHEFVECIASALDARDPYTGNHSERVSDMACELCHILGLSEEQSQEIHIAGHLHDIGKIGIPDRVLLKEGRLDDPFEIYNTYMRRVGGAKNKTKIYGNAKSALTTKEWEALGILELQFPLTEVQLKTKYKQLVKKYHPDLNGGSKQAEEMFKKVAESYRILLKKIQKS